MFLESASARSSAFVQTGRQAHIGAQGLARGGQSVEITRNAVDVTVLRLGLVSLVSRGPITCLPGDIYRSSNRPRRTRGTLRTVRRRTCPRECWLIQRARRPFPATCRSAAGNAQYSKRRASAERAPSGQSVKSITSRGNGASPKGPDVGQGTAGQRKASPCKSCSVKRTADPGSGPRALYSACARRPAALIFTGRYDLIVLMTCGINSQFSRRERGLRLFPKQGGAAASARRKRL
jgi:hypothetical protein